jgi:hypothetical protein
MMSFNCSFRNKNNESCQGRGGGQWIAAPHGGKGKSPVIDTTVRKPKRERAASKVPPEVARHPGRGPA